MASAVPGTRTHTSFASYDCMALHNLHFAYIYIFRQFTRPEMSVSMAASITYDTHSIMSLASLLEPTLTPNHFTLILLDFSPLHVDTGNMAIVAQDAQFLKHVGYRILLKDLNRRGYR